MYVIALATIQPRDGKLIVREYPEFVFAFVRGKQKVFDIDCGSMERRPQLHEFNGE
jgi:hypothetical protein